MVHALPLLAPPAQTNGPAQACVFACRFCEIEARISRYLGGDDGLVIQEARGEAAFLNTGLRWFRQRRRDVVVAEAEAVGPSNVIAFPAPVQAEVPAIEDMEPELELFPLRAAS